MAMAEAFKNLINVALGAPAAATQLQRVSPGFDAKLLLARQASRGLDALEMKARAMQICAALEATLPAGLQRVQRTLIEAALAPTRGRRTAMAGLQGQQAPACAAGSCGRWASSSPAAARTSPNGHWPRCTR
jgi:hypothetical protein